MSSFSIAVVISDLNLAFPFPGSLPISGLWLTVTTADGSSVYFTFVNSVALDGSAVGNHTISVFEYYNAAGGNSGLDVVFVPVTFVDAMLPRRVNDRLLQ
ncbi:hypothetical protein DFH07DRAFT_969358 [Mycena maculata]|uniref:Uncharacterized protein n=1 Tax=Mycena maculata TaxID=230809 RepID=A0AAD7MRT3_9AGAR|nr:hypothetical protein DFH07DRAFT_969358 [Mycena maculata]